MNVNHILNLGKNLPALTKQLSQNTILVRYNRQGIETLGINNNLKNAADDIFEGCVEPILEFVPSKGSSHNYVNINIKNKNSLIKNRIFLIGNSQNIMDFIPETAGRTVKYKLENKNLQKLLAKDEDFNNFFSPYIEQAQYPLMEITTKNQGKYSVTVFSLKDDNELIARAALSTSKTKRGLQVIKYHFSDGTEVVSGNKVGSNSTGKSVNIFSKTLMDKFMKIKDICMTDREMDIISKRYGINGQEPITISDIAGFYNLTAERIREILDMGLRKLKKIKLSPEFIKADREQAEISKYLEICDRDFYKSEKKNLLSDDPIVRKIAAEHIADLIKLSNFRKQHGVKLLS